MSILATLNQDIPPQKSKDFPVQLPFVLTGCAQLCSYPFSRICQPHMTGIDPSKTYIHLRDETITYHREASMKPM